MSQRKAQKYHTLDGNFELGTTQSTKEMQTTNRILCLQQLLLTLSLSFNRLSTCNGTDTFCRSSSGDFSFQFDHSAHHIPWDTSWKITVQSFNCSPVSPSLKLQLCQTIEMRTGSFIYVNLNLSVKF